MKITVVTNYDSTDASQDCLAVWQMIWISSTSTPLQNTTNTIKNQNKKCTNAFSQSVLSNCRKSSMSLSSVAINGDRPVFFCVNSVLCGLGESCFTWRKAHTESLHPKKWGCKMYTGFCHLFDCEGSVWSCILRRFVPVVLRITRSTPHLALYFSMLLCAHLKCFEKQMVTTCWEKKGPDGLHFQPGDIFTIPRTAQHCTANLFILCFLHKKLMQFARQLTLPFCTNGNENTWQSKLYHDTSKQERLINWNVFSESMCWTNVIGNLAETLTPEMPLH